MLGKFIIIIIVIIVIIIIVFALPPSLCYIHLEKQKKREKKFE